MQRLKLLISDLLFVHIVECFKIALLNLVCVLLVDASSSSWRVLNNLCLHLIKLSFVFTQGRPLQNVLKLREGPDMNRRLILNVLLDQAELVGICCELPVDGRVSLITDINDFLLYFLLVVVMAGAIDEALRVKKGIFILAHLSRAGDRQNRALDVFA